MLTAFSVIVPFWFLGCAERELSSNGTKDKVADKPRASLTLRVLVVNEPELAEAINRLRGEWAERSIGEMKATAATWAEVAAAGAVDADVVVFPSRYLGELCTRGLLRPVRANVLESDALQAVDLFPLVRQEIIKWDGQVMALPLGVQLVTAADGLDSHPALALVARAAPQAVSRERLGVLFDSETMNPRITEEAFVDALDELVEHEMLNKERALSEPSPGPSLQGRGGWKHDAALVPVIGYSDRLAGVTTSSRNAASAFKLLEWLAGADASSQLARAGDGTMPVRRSLASSGKWYDSNLTADERTELAKLLDAALSGEQYLMIPRLPGVDDYMAALGEAVTSAARDGVAPQAALEKAVQRWEAITDARGRAEQRQAYLKHLGIEP